MYTLLLFFLPKNADAAAFNQFFNVKVLHLLCSFPIFLAIFTSTKLPVNYFYSTYMRAATTAVKFQIIYYTYLRKHLNTKF